MKDDVKKKKKSLFNHKNVVFGTNVQFYTKPRITIVILIDHFVWFIKCKTNIFDPGPL